MSKALEAADMYSKTVADPNEPKPTPEEITLSHLRSELRIAIEIQADPKRLRAALKALAGKE